MDYKSIYYPESALSGVTHCDSTLAFYIVVNSLIKKEDAVLLDLGCGRGAFEDIKTKGDEVRAPYRSFKGKVEKVIGIDVDQGAKDNPSIDEFHLLVIGQPWPLADNSVDICVSDYVLEHIDDPDFFFSELDRVMKPGGRICMRTVNKRGYVALAARLIPNKYHAKVTGAVQDDRLEEDVFPTHYKCNTTSKLKRLLRDNNFVPTVYTFESEPSYFSFSRILYFFGYLYQKMAPSFFKNVIFVFGVKK